MKEYRNFHDIEDLVRAFEAATMARGDWKHADHLVMALYYVDHYDLDTALAKMREGILNLLKAFEVDLTREMPYHETLTVFWMRTVAEFNATSTERSMIEKVAKLVDAFDKDYPLKFYSRDLLFSDRARAEFVEPDLTRIS